MLFVICQIVMQITVNQYSVASYDVGLSQLYDNQLNSSQLQFRTLDYNKQNSQRSTLTRGTRPDKSSFIPDKSRLARQLTDETTPYPTRISEN